MEITLLLIFGLQFQNCGGPRRFVHAEADISYYERVALAPFVNMTADRSAGEKATNAFLTEVLISKRFEVVEPGKVLRVARESGLPSPLKLGELNVEELKTLGESLGVEAMIMGTVREYNMVRIGQTQYPQVTMDVELIDVATSTTAWVISHTKKGGPNMPFLSIGETFTLGEMLQETCLDIVSKIPK
jgi:curli biogenesis system outer membrane secretion channel CsgG